MSLGEGEGNKRQTNRKGTPITSMNIILKLDKI